jgi:hypothetical protein
LDGKVKIWNGKVLLTEMSLSEESDCCVATLSCHNGGVICVRW